LKICSLVRVILFCGLIAAKSHAAESDRKSDLIVAADGSGDVKTVTEALSRVPTNNRKRFVIFIKRGIYNEQITVAASKGNLSLLGENTEETKITSNVNSAAGGSSWPPRCSAYIGADNFRAENITFENSFGAGAQAMAVVANADRIVFRNCRFLGSQDTLYAKAGRQYFQNCYVEGSRDFICGQAAAVFEDCRLHSKADGYIAAPMRLSSGESGGLIFLHCKATGEKIRNGVFLGRPWGPYGRAVYLESDFGAHIRSEGWNNWDKPASEKTAYFAEYNSKGAGANPARRVQWAHQLTTAEARQFEPENFLKGNDGWNPKDSSR